VIGSVALTLRDYVSASDAGLINAPRGGCRDGLNVSTGGAILIVMLGDGAGGGGGDVASAVDCGSAMTCATEPQSIALWDCSGLTSDQNKIRLCDHIRGVQRNWAPLGGHSFSQSSWAAAVSGRVDASVHLRSGRQWL
jgi:hypothetical protein